MNEDWIMQVSDAMDAAHAQWRTLKNAVKDQLGIKEPIHIMAYWGYGTPQQLRVKGRVLQDEGISLREENDPVWKNLLNMYRRFETDEIPGAKVKIQVGEQEQWAIANDEGFFNATVELAETLSGDRLWHPVDLTYVADDPADSFQTTTEAIVVTEQAQFGVISDIDDTIMHTAATDVLKMITIAYFGNERTRRPFEGVPEFYNALQRGTSGNEGNPIFYVSSSAWNMYDLFAKFMEFNDVPKGPFFLRDIELNLANWLSFDHRSHKREQIEPIFDQYPDLPFILIGDTGQKDAEIYYQLVKDYPGRIKAIYLRDVTSHDRDRTAQLRAIGEEIQAQGIDYLVFAHTAIAAQHAADQGWIQQLSYLAADDRQPAEASNP